MCIIDSNKEVSMSDLQVGSALTNDYEGIIKSRVVLTKAIANLKLDIEYKDLYNAVSIENPDGTRIIKINVVSQDQKEAVDIANEILQISIEEIPNVLGSSVPTVLDKAHKSNPDRESMKKLISKVNEDWNEFLKACANNDNTELLLNMNALIADLKILEIEINK